MSVLMHSNAEYDTIDVYKRPTRVRLTRRGNGCKLLRSCNMTSIPRISTTPSIYQIRCLTNGKVYVGSAVNPRNRWMAHRTCLRGGTHHSRYLQHSWDKYGEDAFVFEIIEPVLFTEDLIVREQHWIDVLRAADRKHGFNLSPTAGSTLGVKATNETRAKLSAVSKVRAATPAERARKSKKMKAMWEDPAYRANQSEQSKARYADPSVRAAQSERMKVLCADPDTRARLTDQVNARFADPEQRANVSAHFKEFFADPDNRARQSERLKAHCADPEERSKMSERMKAQWANPEKRAQWAEKNRARWADPEFRARQKAGCEAASRKKRQAETQPTPPVVVKP